MQLPNRIKILLVLMLILSVFSFSMTTSAQESSQIFCESLLDDNGELDDKEEDTKQKTFGLYPSYLSYAVKLLSNIPLFLEKAYTPHTQGLNFRPPIFS